MFNPEDFELTLEAQLKLRVLKDEIAGCSDVKQLQDNLTEMSDALHEVSKHYQQSATRKTRQQTWMNF